jgi:group I intron endonuclease
VVFIIETAGIYAIINKANWKVYVGQSVSCNARWVAHKSASKRGIHNNGHLQAAFDKYGTNNFMFFVIEECSEEVRDERERYWINHFNSCDENCGYNMQTGGSFGKRHAESTKRKIGDAHRGEKNYFYGKKFSNEHKEKLSKAKKDRPRTEMELEVLKEMIKNNTVSITDEMVKDVENGMSRRKFGKKYGTQNVWRRIKGSYSLSEELVG